MKRHEFKVEIEMDWNATKAEAYRKLKAWLEHNGHTSTGHGFTIIAIHSAAVRA